MNEVYLAISAVSKALAHEGISKDRSNQQQGYKFRGIDDCLNALASLLPAHELIIIPSVLEREVIERQTKSGGSLFYVTVKVQFSFISTKDGSRHDAVVYGEAMDSADKATNKAMSAAYKYAVLLTFCIPTEGDNDADAVTHEVAAKQSTDLKAVHEKLQHVKAQRATYPVSSGAIAPSTVTAEDLADMQEDELTAVQAKLNAARQAPMPSPDEHIPLVPESPAGFTWTIKGKHQGRSIIDIDSDYLSWYEQNGRMREHVEAAQAELDRREAATRPEDVGQHKALHATPPQSGSNQDAPASPLLAAYLEQIQLSETVSECSAAINAGLGDPKLSAFDTSKIQDAGKARILELRKKT